MVGVNEEEAGNNVDPSGNSVHQSRHSSRELPTTTVSSGDEASSLHSSECDIFFGASSLVDDEEEFLSETSVEEESMRSEMETASSNSYESSYNSSQETISSHSRSQRESAISSQSEYTSESSWLSGTESSFSGSSNVSSHEEGSQSGHQEDQDSTEKESILELQSVSSEVATSTIPLATSQKGIGTSKATAIVIDCDINHGDVTQKEQRRCSAVKPTTASLPLEEENNRPPKEQQGSELNKRATTSLSFEGSIDDDIFSLKNANTPKTKAKSTFLEHVKSIPDQYPDIHDASTNRDISTVHKITKTDAQDAFLPRVPQVLACVVNKDESFRDDLSSIDNRTIQERAKDSRRRSRPLRIDEEQGHNGVWEATDISASQTVRHREHDLLKTSVFDGFSKLEWCFCAVISVSLFILIILIAILLARN
jgi:hypothetical protein